MCVEWVQTWSYHCFPKDAVWWLLTSHCTRFHRLSSKEGKYLGGLCKSWINTVILYEGIEPLKGFK